MIIDLELLAVVWTITKCDIFLAGLPHFSVVTDNHPLIPILNNHSLDKIQNPWLQLLKTEIMGYTFTPSWLKGTLNNAAEAEEALAKSEIDEMTATKAAADQSCHKY